MKNYSLVVIIGLVIGWLHLILFSLLIVALIAFVGFTAYQKLNVDGGRPQDIVWLVIAAFVSISFLGVLIHACYQYIKGLMSRDHDGTCMFNICNFGLWLIGGGSLLFYWIFRGSDDILQSKAIYLISVLAIFIFELIIFILNLIIFYKLKADQKRRRKARREARRLKTISNKVGDIEEVDGDGKDAAEFVCMMIDTGKLRV